MANIKLVILLHQSLSQIQLLKSRATYVCPYIVQSESGIGFHIEAQSLNTKGFFSNSTMSDTVVNRFGPN
jgi:hypothetical protein